MENAIKHGVSNLLEGGKIRIYNLAEPAGQRIVVEDNAGVIKRHNTITMV